ncbi:MAG: NAD-dependent epimerase/dehydratase family protein [Chitinispirillaceae bacterium]
MRILIIGGTGNISSEVTDLLLKTNHSLTLVSSGKRPVPHGCRHIRADRFNSHEFENALRDENPDVVIDFMAFTPGHLKSDYKIFRDRIKQFIFISSATVYHKPHLSLPITEQTPRKNPFWPYAQDKIACEEYLESVHDKDFPVTIVRPSHTFGNTWIPSPINGCGFTIAQRILDGKPFVIHDKGESLWTLTASSDFALGLTGLIGNSNASGEDFHITSDERLSWNRIYEELGAALGTEIKPVHIPSEFIAKVYPDALGMLMGDKRENGVFDNSKIKRFVPDFGCRKDYATQIRESVNWFLEKPQRQVSDAGENKLIDSIISAWNSAK